MTKEQLLERIKYSIKETGKAEVCEFVLRDMFPLHTNYNGTPLNNPANEIDVWAKKNNLMYNLDRQHATYTFL